MATAQNNMQNFTPTQDDYAVTHMLAKTFGDVTGNIFGATVGAGDFANIMGTAIAYFNFAVMFFGTVVLIYVTVFGVVNTANDGYALGKKWSSTYTMLRIGGAAASLIPTASGYSIIQLMALQIVVWGVGIADTTWRETVNAVMTKSLPNAFMAQEGDGAAVNKLASDMLLAKICALELNATLGQVTNGATDIKAVAESTSRLDGSVLGAGGTLVDTTTYTFRDTAPQPAANGEAICGRVIFEFKKKITYGSNLASVSSNAYQMMGYELTNSVAFTEDLADQIVKNVTGAAFNAMDLKLTTLAAQIHAGTGIDNKLYQEAINDYLNTMKSGYDSNLATLNGTSPIIKSFLQDSTEQGWVFAGMWHRRLSQIQEAIKDSYRVYPRSEAPNTQMILRTAPQLDQGFLTQYAQAQTLAATAIQNGGEEWDVANPGVKKPGSAPLNIDFESGDVSHTWKKWTASIGQSIVAGIIDLIAIPDTGGWHDPVIQVKNLGDYTMVWAESAIAAKSLLVIGINAADAAADTALNPAPGKLVNLVTGAQDTKTRWVQFALSTIDELWGLIAPSLWGLLYVGYFMSIFLPMVPYMIFTLAVVGWLIAVIETIIAAPMWAVMHMTPESGGSFIGSQQQGYLLLLSVFFKPVLTVLGLIVSLIVLRPVMDYVNTGFIGQMATQQSDSVTGLGSIFGYLLAYAFLTLAVFLAIFALPQDMGDRVLKWISAGIGGLGEKEAMGRIESGGSSMAREGLRTAQQRDAKSSNRLAEAIAARKTRAKADQPIGAGSGTQRGFA